MMKGIGFLVALGIFTSVNAQQLPARPVRLVVGFTPGGGVDIVSGFQSVRPPTAQWLQPNGTSARPKGVGESIQLRSLKGTLARCNPVLKLVLGWSAIGLMLNPSHCAPSGGAMGASLVVN